MLLHLVLASLFQEHRRRSEARRCSPAAARPRHICWSSEHAPFTGWRSVHDTGGQHRRAAP